MLHICLGLIGCYFGKKPFHLQRKSKVIIDIDSPETDDPIERRNVFSNGLSQSPNSTSLPIISLNIFLGYFFSHSLTHSVLSNKSH